MHVPRGLSTSLRRTLKSVASVGLALTFAVSHTPAADATVIVPAQAAFQRPDLALASNAAACAGISAANVQQSIDQLRAMQVARLRPAAAETVESRNMLANKNAYLASILKTKPAFTQFATYHAMTPAEYATFRAAETAVRQGVSAAAAIGACRTQAQTAASRANPLFQNCGGMPCGEFPPILRIDTDQNSGNYSNLYSSGNVPDAASGFTSSGVQQTSGSYAPVTISGLPGTTGPVPGWQHNLNLSGIAKFNASYAMPNPQYVPQTGWTTLPGLSWQNKPVSAYLNPTASQPNVVVPLDNNDWYETYQTSPGVENVYYDFATTGQSGTDSNMIFSAGANKIGTDFMEGGGLAMAVGALATGSSLFTVAVAGPPLVAIGAVVVIAGTLIKWLFGGGSGGGSCGIIAPRTFALTPAAATGPHTLCDSDDEDDDF